MFFRIVKTLYLCGFERVFVASSRYPSSVSPLGGVVVYPPRIKIPLFSSHLFLLIFSIITQKGLCPLPFGLTYQRPVSGLYYARRQATKRTENSALFLWNMLIFIHCVKTISLLILVRSKCFNTPLPLHDLDTNLVYGNNFFCSRLYLPYTNQGNQFPDLPKGTYRIPLDTHSFLPRAHLYITLKCDSALS